MLQTVRILGMNNSQMIHNKMTYQVLLNPWHPAEELLMSLVELLFGFGFQQGLTESFCRHAMHHERLQGDWLGPGRRTPTRLRPPRARRIHQVLTSSQQMFTASIPCSVSWKRL